MSKATDEDQTEQATKALLALGDVLEFGGQPTYQTARLGDVTYLVIGTALRKGGEQWGAFGRPAGSTKAPVWCGYYLATQDEAKAACQKHATTGKWY